MNDLERLDKDTDELINSTLHQAPAADMASHGGAANVWSPDLIQHLVYDIVGIVTLFLIFMGFLVWRRVKIADVLRLSGLPLIVISAVFLIVVGYNQEQIGSAMGLLGAIAGYLLHAEKNAAAKD